MILHITSVISLLLPLTTLTQEISTKLNINVTQTSYVINKAQLRVTWDKVNNFDGEYSIQHQNYWPLHSTEWKIQASNINEATLEETIACGSKYRIKISYNIGSIRYFDETDFFVGKLPGFGIKPNPYYSKIWWPLLDGTQYIIRMISENSCEFLYVGKQCKNPNAIVSKSLTECTESKCARRSNKEVQQVAFKTYLPQTKLTFNLNAIQGQVINEYCEAMWTTVRKSEEVSDVKIVPELNYISINWSPPLKPGGLIQHYFLKLTNSFNTNCDYAIMSCKDCYKMESYTNDTNRQDMIKNANQCQPIVNKGFVLNQNNYSFTFHNLRPSTKYIVSISAVNSKELGDFFSSTTQTVEGKPQKCNGLEFNKLSSTSLELHLKCDNDTVTIDNYNIKIDGEFTLRSSQTPNYVVDNLEACTEYCFVIRAGKANGYGNWSDKYCTKTNPNTPPIPTQFKVMGTSADAISIDWKLQNFKCSARYQVEMESNGRKSEFKDTANNNYRWNGLPQGVNFSFRVRAIAVDDSNLISPWSESASTTTILQVPGKPENIQLLNIKANEIEVQWDIPSGPNNVVTQYHVERKMKNKPNDKATIVVQNGSSVELDGLDECSEYCISVWGENTAGNGTSTSNCAKTSAPTPNIPTQLKVKGASADAILIDWKLENVKCSARYQVEMESNGRKSEFKDTANNNYRWHGLPQGVNFSFRVRAIAVDDSNLISPWSESASTTTILQVPGTPENITLLNIQVNGMKVQWQEPSGPNNVVTQYYVERKMKNRPNDRATIVVQNSFSVELYGLDECSEYCVTVWGENTAGNGTSTSNCAKTSAPTPPIPTQFKVKSASADTISIDWKLENFKCSARYEVEMESNGNTELKDTANNNYRWHGLPQGVNISFRVRAIAVDDSSLISPWSESASATTILQVPDTPENITLSNIQGNVMTVKWQDPNPPNNVVTQYYVERWMKNRPNDRATIVVQNGSSVELDGLLGCSEYCVTVWGKNAAGNGTSTSSECATTSVAIPPMPTQVKVKGTSGDTISIDWKLHNYNCAARYQIEKTSYFTSVYQTSNDTRYDWEGLPPSVTLSFRVRAIAGEASNYVGLWSKRASTTTLLQENSYDNMPQVKNDVIESEIKKINITNANAVNTTHSLTVITSDSRKESSINKNDVIIVTATLDRVIKQGMAVKENPELVLKVFDNMLNLSSSFLETKELQSKENTIASNLINLLDEASQSLNSTEVHKYERIAIAAYDPNNQKNKTEFDDIIVFNPEEKNTYAASSIEPKRIQIAINMTRKLNKKITFTLMDDASLMRAQEKGHKSDIVTSVISATVQKDNINEELGTISATIDLTPARKTNSVVCVFWDPVKLAWSSRGCRTTRVNSNSNTRRCQCSHLTSFALLMKVDCKSPSSSSHERALGVISYICLTLSSISLAFIIAVYSCFLFRKRQSSAGSRGLNNTRQSKNILALSVTLFCANMAFIFGGYFSSQLDSKSISCKFVGGVLHFGYLSSIIWSFIEAASVGNSIVRLHYSSRIPDSHVANYFLKASVFGWGLPALIVALTAGLYRGENYGYDVCAGVVDNTADSIKLTEGGLCFLKQTPFYLTFMTPVALFLGFNLIIMLLILPIILKCGTKSTPKATSAKRNTSQSVKGIFGLICILSLTWIFGYLQISHGKVFFQYIFTLTTALQGFFILVFFILLKPNIRGFVLSKSTTTTATQSTTSTKQ